MIQPGKYRAYAKGAKFDKTKAKGTDYVAVEFEIMEGPHKGETITWYGYFTEATQGRTVESLQHAGCTFPGDDVTDLEGLGTTEVQIVVNHEEYQGKTSARVQWVNSMSVGPQVHQMAPDQKSAFAARLRGLVQMKKRTGDQARTRQQAAASSAGDDIPW